MRQIASPARTRRRSAPGRPLRRAGLLSILSIAAIAGLSLGDRAPPVSGAVPAPTQPIATAAPPAGQHALFAPTPALGGDALKLWSNAPLASALRFGSAQPVPRAEPPIVLARQDLPSPAPAATPLEPVRVAEAPLPTPRPPEFKAPAPPRVASRQAPRRTRVAVAPAPDNRSFFEKLFGVQFPTPPAPALSYASLGNAPLVTAPSGRFSPGPSSGGGVAVYDISARTVTLPSGERLEAHSGLGDKLDDPRHVHMRMRGATPPGAYDLTEREKLFHGVRAIRLNPVGGSGAIFGRAGLLAHTFMLGPNGDSNGCVSFRDYDRFLQAYLRGEIRRLVVVSGRGQDGPGAVRVGRRQSPSLSDRDA